MTHTKRMKHAPNPDRNDNITPMTKTLMAAEWLWSASCKRHKPSAASIAELQIMTTGFLIVARAFPKARSKKELV